MSGNAVELRLATVEDALAMTGLFLAARRAAMPYLPELHSEPSVAAWMKSVVVAESIVLLASLAGIRAAGFAALRGDYLEHLYVAPEAQGCGVGSRLLAAAKQSRAQDLRLFVFQRNVGARGFYERRGFRLVALRDGADNEEGEPDAVYDWRPQRLARKRAAATDPDKS